MTDSATLRLARRVGLAVIDPRAACDVCDGPGPCPRWLSWADPIPAHRTCIPAHWHIDACPARVHRGPCAQVCALDDPRPAWQ